MKMLSKSLKLENRSPQSGDIVQKIILATAVILAIAGGAYIYFIAPGQGIDIEFVLPEEEIFVGDVFEAEVVVLNNSQGKINNTRLSLALPPGLRLLSSPERINEVRDLEDIKRGEIVKEKYELVALPSDNGDAYRLEAKVNYEKESLSADFEYSENKKLKLEKTNFNLQLRAPDTIFTNQEFQIEVSYTSKEVKEGPGKFIVIEGESLTILSADPTPVGEDNRWLIEEGGDHKISAFTQVTNKTVDVQKIISKVVLEFGGEDYVLEQKEVDVLLAPSPLTFNISLSDPKEFASLGEKLNYNINYRNNTGVDLQNVSIEVVLIGDMFDFETLRTNGSYNGLTKSVVWDANNISSLKSVGNGHQETFGISINVKSRFPTYTLSDRNFALKAKASIESPTVTQGVNTDKTSNTKVLETRVAGSLSIDAKALFRDPASGLVNSGPFPPRVGVPTQYTVHWVLNSLGTDLNNVEARATLPSNARIDNLTTPNIGVLSTLVEDGSTQVIWKIESVSATNLLQGGLPKAIIQVSMTPSLGMVGQYAPILGLTTISAKDAFTGIELLDTDEALTTRLSDDSTVGVEGGKVLM